MLKTKYQRLMLVIFATLITVAPSITQAAASIEKPGIQTKVEEEKAPENIQKQDVPEAQTGKGQTFAVGKISLKSDDIKLGDYSSLLAKYENRSVSIDELNELCVLITKDLRSNGYPAAAVYVPKQSFAMGSDMSLAVEPGRYGEISVDNQSDLPDDIAEGYLAGLKRGKIIKSIELETAMQKLVGIGGIQASGMLSAGKETGTTDLVVKIQKGKTATEILYAENYGTVSAGRYRYGLQGNVQFPKIAGMLNYALVISNGGQHNYNIGYSQYVGRSATRLGLNLSSSDYELGGVYRALGAQGKAYTLALSGTTPVYKSWRDSLDFSYGYAYRALEDEQETYGVDMKKHTHSFYAGVDGTIRRGKSTFNYGLTHTLGTLHFDNDWANYIYGPSNTEGTYNKTNLNASYLYAFDHCFDVQLRYTAQLAYQNLDGSEEITLGGINGVRAYPTGIGSGDEGYLANLELRYHTKVPGLTFSTYLDCGHVKVTHDTDSLSYGGETAKGWGISVSYTKPSDYFVRLDYARRIGGLSYYTNDKEAKANGRIWFMLGKVF